MSTLVVGATGDLGGNVVRRLRECGAAVRALARPARDAAELEALGVEIVRGDLLDPASLALACRDVRTVVCTATAIARLLAGDDGPSLPDVDDRGVGNLVAAAETAGVERFVYVSYLGVEAGLGFPLERAKAANEHRLRRARLHEVIVRPDAFQDVHLAPLGRFDVVGGKVEILGRGDSKRRWIACDDVAALVTALALEDDPPRLVEVGGPDALSKNEAADLAQAIGGGDIKRRHMPRAAARLGSRLVARKKPELATVFGLGLMMDLHETHADDAALRDRGIDPQPVAAHFGRQFGLQ
jgi:uncharacterized protein YbjT (DUF2867 family)